MRSTSSSDVCSIDDHLFVDDRNDDYSIRINGDGDENVVISFHYILVDNKDTTAADEADDAAYYTETQTTVDVTTYTTISVGDVLVDDTDEAFSSESFTQLAFTSFNNLGRV